MICKRGQQWGSLHGTAYLLYVGCGSTPYVMITKAAVFPVGLFTWKHCRECNASIDLHCCRHHVRLRDSSKLLGSRVLGILISAIQGYYF